MLQTTIKSISKDSLHLKFYVCYRHLKQVIALFIKT